MRTKKEIIDEIVDNQYTDPAEAKYGNTQPMGMNDYLFLEVLVDIRDQLDKIRDQLTRTI